MRALRLVSCLLVAGGLGACTPTPPGTQATVPAPAGIGIAAVMPMGKLHITIRWPRQIQLLPYSTNRLAVQVLDASNHELAAASLEQSTGASTSETQVAVPAGIDLRVFVQGYQDALKIAEGMATASIKVNERTPLAIHLTPTYVPTLSSYAPNGGVGAAIALSGSHFGASRNVPIQVTFGGMPATAVYRQNDALVHAIVPPSVVSGPIVVTADGVPSAPSGTFWVLTQLSPLAASSYSLTVGASLSLDVAASTAVGPCDDPYLEWSLVPVDLNAPEQMASGSFSNATGSEAVFTASATGSGLLRVRSGALQRTARLDVE